ncbi:MAG: ATP-binding protein, partial [Nanoarchaeota archaeon]
GVPITNKFKSQITDIARNFDPKFQVALDVIDNVLVINVPEGKNKPYSAGGKFYLRYGPNSQQLGRDEIRDLFHKEGLIKFDVKLNPAFQVDKDLSQKAFDTFLRLSKISPILDQRKLLQNQSLVEDGQMKNAGVLLFCKKISGFLPNATVACILFQGDDKYKIIDQREFNGDLYSNYQNVFAYLKSKLNTEYIIRGGPREEKLELPEDALREAILNAIAHRDYFSPANIQINLFKNRVEITNPGGLIGNITVEDLFERSIPRNHLLFGLMQRMELVEKAGSGLVRIQRAMKEYRLSEPVIKADKNWFSITFKRPDLEKESYEQRLGGQKKWSDRWSEKELTERQIEIVRLLQANPSISRRELAEKLDINPYAVQKHLETLKEKGVLKIAGGAKG